jgi:hypothetical protein
MTQSAKSFQGMKIKIARYEKKNSGMKKYRLPATCAGL